MVLVEVMKKNTSKRNWKKAKIIRHVLGHHQFLTYVCEDKIVGKNTRGRRRVVFFKNREKRWNLHRIAF